MAVATKLTKEIAGLSVLVIIIVVFTIVINKFKDVEGAACSGHFGTWNSSSELCMNSTGGTTAQSTLGSSMDTATGALDEPVTWIAIIVIIVVVVWLMAHFKGKNSGFN